MKKYVIIVAAGAGTRFGSYSLKQFALLSGIPVLMHSIAAYHAAFPEIEIIVVVPEQYIATWEELCQKYDFTLPHRIVRGGPERFHSVKNGLQFIIESGLVAIHDGARPLVRKTLIHEAFAMAEKFGAVVPVVEINESVRITDGATHKPFERKKLRIVQTPQVFRTGVIKKAYLQSYDPKFTDDATVAEAAGERIVLINGSRDNIKITYPEDIRIAETLIDALKNNDE